jgi:hypothetical protein
MMAVSPWPGDIFQVIVGIPGFFFDVDDSIYSSGKIFVPKNGA